MQTANAQQIVIQYVGPADERIKQLIHEPLTTVAPDTTVTEPADRTISMEADVSPPRLIACTAAAVEAALIPVEELTAGEWLIIVDTDSSTDIELAAYDVPTSYIHTESPPQQIRSQLRTIVAAVRSDGREQPKADASPTAGTVTSAVGIEVPIPVIIAAVGSQRVVAVNDAAMTLFDQSHDSLVGCSLDALHPTSATSRCSMLRESAITTGQAQHRAAEDEEPVSVLTGDDEEVPVDYSAVTVTVDGAEYLIETFKPATAQVEQMTALQRQSVAMDASLTGISILSPDGEYVYMNEAHAAIFHYDSAALLGETWRMLYDEERQARIDTTVFPTVESEGSWEGELTGQRADGEPVDQHVSLTTLPDGGLVCVNRDIGDRKRTERQLSQLRETVATLMLADDRTTVVDTAIEAITDIIELPVVAYYRRDKDTLRPDAISSKAKTILDEFPAFEPGEGLIWTAVETGTQQYYPDLQVVEGRYNPETVLRTELQLPVADDGVILVGSTTPDDITESERDLLGILGDRVETALSLLERAEQLQQAKAKIAAERQQLRDVIDAIPQLVCAQGQSGEVIFANEAVATMFDTTVAEIEGTTPADTAGDDHEWRSLFHTDDQSVAPGESRHIWGTTVPDADGDERVLETWKLGFEPVDSEEPAILLVSNDVTELDEAQTALTRLQRLKSHYKVGNELLQTRTPEEVFTIGSQAIAEGLTGATVSVYRWDESAAVLSHVSTEPVSDTAHPSRLTMNDTERWRAFTEETVTVSDDGDVSVPVSTDGLLVVSFGTAHPSTEAIEFLESAADTLAIGIRQARQNALIDALKADTEQFATNLSRQRTLLNSFTAAVDTIGEAESQTELFDALTSFCDANWEYAWVGTYQPQTETVTPATVCSRGGPATTITTEEGSARSPPMLAAAATRKPVAVTDTRAGQPRSDWERRLLTYGYQSAIAVPICDSGVLHGVIEIAASETAAFDEQSEELITVLCQAVAKRLNHRNRSPPAGSNNTAAVFELVCTEEHPLFPALPPDAVVRVLTVTTVDSGTRALTVRIERVTADRFERYVHNTPGLAAFKLVADQTDTDSVLATVQLTTTVRDQTAQLFETLHRNDAAIATVHSRHDTETVQLTARQATAVGDIVDTLQESLACRLISKQTTTAADAVTHRQQITDTLTDRQHELFRTAYTEGYYEQPKGISGAALADLFDISQSTVHEHLRSAEQRVAAALFDDPIGASDNS